ncbi:unnamed protein product [Discula destructiva]
MYVSPGQILATAICLLVRLGSAQVGKRHVQLVTPTPFEWAEYGPTNPLKTDGSDYPCKIPHGESFVINGTATELAIGEEQTVSFSGWAVHGGGSCQFALTEGHSPRPDSAWKVIHSIEGGCPKANVAGNLEPGQSPDSYTFTIPDDFAAGDYTWAWTWVNKIASSGEFYMNCAPITVIASPGSTKNVKARRESYYRRDTSPYPDLFLANIGTASSGCTTAEAVGQQVAIRFPHPGNSVSYPNGQDDLFEQACDGNPRNNGVAVGESPQSSGSAVGIATGGSGGVSLSVAPVSRTMGSLRPSSVAPTMTTVMTASSKQVSISAVLVTSTPSTSLDTMVSIVTASAETATGTTSLGSSCEDGHLLCLGETHFSTCTGGAWDAPQALAAETTCEEGEGLGLTVVNHF